MGAEIEKKEKHAEETQRPSPTTLTQHQFLSWKQNKDAAESARKAEASRKRAEDIAAGTVQMNGRELFLHEPWSVVPGLHLIDEPVEGNLEPVHSASWFEKP